MLAFAGVRKRKKSAVVDSVLLSGGSVPLRARHVGGAPDYAAAPTCPRSVATFRDFYNNTDKGWRVDFSGSRFTHDKFISRVLTRCSCSAFSSRKPVCLQAPMKNLTWTTNVKRVRASAPKRAPHETPSRCRTQAKTHCCSTHGPRMTIRQKNPTSAQCEQRKENERSKLASRKRTTSKNYSALKKNKNLQRQLTHTLRQT